MSDEKPTTDAPKEEEEKKKEEPLMMTRQTIAAANYKEEGTKLLKDGKLGKAITKYQLCRMNTQQTAIQKTKDETAYEKRVAEKRAKKAAEEEEKKQAEVERRKAAGEPEPEDEEQETKQELTPEQQKAQETQQMAAMMQAQMGGGGMPPGMPPGGMPPGGMPPGGMPPGMGMPGMPPGGGGGMPGMGDPMAMMGAMGGGGQSNNSDDEIRLCRHLYLASLNNLAHCFMQKEQFTQCVEVATDAITFDPKCSKAYYRRGVAWTKKGNATKGSADLQTALDLNPGDAGIVEMLNWSKSMIEQEKVNEKKAMARMFT